MSALQQTAQTKHVPQGADPPSLVLRVPVDPDEVRSVTERLAAAVAVAFGGSIRLEVAPTSHDCWSVGLAERCQQLRDLGVSDVGWCRLGGGRIADAILEGEQGPGTIICMAVGSRHAPHSMLFSSVTEEVLRRSPVPVLIAGPRLAPPTERITQVVVAADGSEVSGRAVQVAAGLAAKLLTPLRTVRVEPPPRGGVGPSTLPIPHAAGVELVEGTEPVGAILGSLGGTPTILVIGAHKRGGSRRFALGSVALDLVRWAPCPVLVVPAPVGAR